MQYERLLSASGPTGGELIRPSDGKHAHDIAFISCVGSRNEDLCAYCSKFCCMYQTKEGVITREHAPDTSVTIFFNDIRVYCLGWQEKLLQHRCIARISKIRIESVAHEVEKRSEM
jgi:heterodisulfide reductase subunit A